MKLFPLLSLILLACAAAAPGGAPKKRNVLLIVADDLNLRIAPLGDPDAITPNLTRFAARSVNYRNCIANYSLCVPSRGTMFTGIYPWKLGVHHGGQQHARPLVVVPGRPWLSTHFRDNDYFAGSYGKIEHLGIAKNWDELVPRVYPVHPADKFVERNSWGGRKGISGDTTYEVYDVHPDEFMDGRATSSALESMEACLQEDKNFFVAVGFYRPHSPWIVPKSIADLYDPANLTLPENPPGSYSDSYWPSYAYSKGTVQDTRPFITETDLRDMLKAYYCAVTLVDHQVGRLLDFADQHDLWEDTVIIFVSDNGFSLMEHRHMFSKVNYSRESLGVPLMIYHPGMTTEGRHCDRQVSLVDLLPTTIDLAGLDPFPKPVDGQSIAPLQDDPEAVWDKPALSCTSYPLSTRVRFRMAQLGPWKLIEGPYSENIHRVMNHDTDPFEHFPTYPNGIDDETFAALEHALMEIPFTPGTFYTSRPTFADRDGDRLSDEAELDLAVLGFSPYRDDTERLSQFESSGIVVEREADGNTVRMNGLPLDPDLYSPYHIYPLILQRSPDLSAWDEFSSQPEMSPAGFFEWTDRTGTTHPDVFYRVSIAR